MKMNAHKTKNASISTVVLGIAPILVSAPFSNHKMGISSSLSHRLPASVQTSGGEELVAKDSE
jgi:hypothetical protein